MKQQCRERDEGERGQVGGRGGQRKREMGKGEEGRRSKGWEMGKEEGVKI